MGLFDKLFSGVVKTASKSSAVRSQGAKQVQKGKSGGLAGQAFRQAGKDARNNKK